MGIFDRNPEGGAIAAPTSTVLSGGGGGGMDWSVPVNSNITVDADSTYEFGANGGQFYIVHSQQVYGDTGLDLVAQAAAVGLYASSTNSGGVDIYDWDNVASVPLRFWDNNSSNYVALKAPAVVATNIIWTLPSADGTNGQVLSTNGAGVLSWVAAGGSFPLLAPAGTAAAPSYSFSADSDTGINQADGVGTLSVSVNGANRFIFNATSFYPNGGDGYNLGLDINTGFRNAYINRAIYMNSGIFVITGLGDLNNPTTGDLMKFSIGSTGGSDGNIGFYTSNATNKSGSMFLTTGDSNSAGAFSSGVMHIETGGQTNASNTVSSGGINLITGNNIGVAGTANSGNISLQTGTVVGGTRGKIIFKDGTEGTAGHVWTSSGTGGEGYWAAPSGGSPSFPLLATDGTAAAPSYSFASDPDTGIWRHGVNSIGFATNGVNRIYIDTVTMRPQSDNGFGLGETGNYFTYGYINSVYSKSGGGVLQLSNSLSSTPSSSVMGGLAQTGAAAKSIGIITLNSASANTSDIRFETGNATAGAFNSGNIILYTGSSAGGARGSVLFDEASRAGASNGYVWTLQDQATGRGAWVAAAGGTPAADSINSTHILLDNATYLRWKNSVATPVNVLSLNATDKLQIGSSIIGFHPETNLGCDFGTATLRWNQGFINEGFIRTLRYAPTGNGNLLIESVDNTSTGGINIETGNASAGNSGSIAIRTGTSVGGTRGAITLDANTLAINASLSTNLVPDSATRNLGDTNTRFNFIFGTFGFFGSGPANGIRIAGSETMPSGATTVATVRAESNQHVGLYSSNSTATKNVYIESGNASGGNSGNINIQTGTATATRGDVIINSRYATINAERLQPSADDVTKLGGAGSRWSEFAASLGYFYGSGNLGLKLSNQENLPSTATGVFGLTNYGAIDINLFTINSTSSRSVRVETGNASSGASGGITLQTGTATGTRGDINLNARRINYPGRGYLGLGQAADFSYWGSDIPGLLFDLAETEVATAFGAGLLYKGDGTSSAVMLTSDSASVNGSATIAIATGNGTSGSSGQVDIQTGNASAGSSGYILLQTGSATGGTRGNVVLTANRVDASASVGPLRVPNLAADPGSPLNGDIWYNTTSNQLKARVNGSTVVLA